MALISLSDFEGVRSIALDNPPANTMSTASMKALLEAFENAEKNVDIQGVILTGNYPFFSAGLDLKELASIDVPGFSNFLEIFFALVQQILRSSKPVIAAISGHSPAGGCVLALCCDYRIMVDNDAFKIGLNEIPMGIMVPPSILELYADVIGRNKAYQFLLEGKLHTASDALQIGLVDALTYKETLISESLSKMKQYISADAETFRKAKQNLRVMLLKRMAEADERAIESIENHFWKPSTRQYLKTVLAKLTGSA